MATAVSCNGTATQFSSSGITWVFTYNPPAASFAETIEGCTLTSSGTVACNDGIFTTLFSNENSCNPAACTIWGAQCTATPGAAASITWAVSQETATSFLATSQNDPDGGPPPLTTCTSLGLSNPVQVTWTKQ
jgi:hypothetical protein